MLYRRAEELEIPSRDASELIPWIRTFICRITDISISNKALETQFKYRYHLPIRYYWQKKLTNWHDCFPVSSLLLRIPRLCLEHLMQKSTILIKMIIAFANGMSSKT